jgi:ATP-dependent DNA helicase DinG
MKISEVLKPKSTNELNSVIDEYIAEFEDTYLPEEFKWRTGQKEAVEQIVQTYLEKKYKIVILDAPVGSGKSLIAMAVSFILNKTEKKGYVLTSETSLQDQYESDIKKFHLPWGSVKGIDHYTCVDNAEKHSLGTCKIRNISPIKMECHARCPYFSARNFAANADTAVLNYNYWLIMQNFVNSKTRQGESSPAQIFQPRDFTVCDEAHKILDIVQSHYSPRFTKNTIDKLQKLSDFFKVHKVKDHQIDVDVVKSAIEEMWKTEDQEFLHGHLCSTESALKNFLKSTEILRDKVDSEYRNKKPPKEWMEALYLSDWIKDLHCKVEDYNYIIEHTNTRNLIKNPTIDELVFNCLEESFLMQRYFHRFTGFTVLMSATFSDPVEYMRSINLKGAKHIKMENTFPFEKSPIYYYPKRRMSYKQIDQNREWLYEKINEIIEKHPEESGIIHSASYDLTRCIRDNLSFKNRKRVFVYEGTEEKRQMLDMMKATPGKIIMGPSILEGLDLKDEWSRFQIFAKVPYMSLSDRFVKTKLATNPGWYRWKAIINILQGTGRSIRNEDDWAITYILDGSLSDLIHNNRKAFPNDFLRRIVVVNE